MLGIPLKLKFTQGGCANSCPTECFWATLYPLDGFGRRTGFNHTPFNANPLPCNQASSVGGHNQCCYKLCQCCAEVRCVFPPPLHPSQPSHRVQPTTVMRLSQETTTGNACTRPRSRSFHGCACSGHGGARSKCVVARDCVCLPPTVSLTMGTCVCVSVSAPVPEPFPVASVPVVEPEFDPDATETESSDGDEPYSPSQYSRRLQRGCGPRSTPLPLGPSALARRHINTARTELNHALDLMVNSGMPYYGIEIEMFFLISKVSELMTGGRDRFALRFHSS